MYEGCLDNPRVSINSNSVFLAAIILLLFFLRTNYVQAQETPLTSTDLIIDLSEVESFHVQYGLSTFEPWEDGYSLTVVDGSDLTDGTNTVPLTAISPILQSLHTLYPSTRPVFVQRWSDDYPYAEVNIALKDGRYLLITSQSQYGRLIPWNVQIWQGNPYENGTLQNSYILLHEDFHMGLSELWMELTGSTFPRDYGPEYFWEHYDKTETIDFSIYNSYTSATSTNVILGASLGVVEPFLPILEKNDVIASLLEDGYSVFDMAFDVTTTVEQMRPVQYSGTIAFASPDGKDVIVTTIDIQLEPEWVVETPLTEIEVENRLKERREFAFLEEASQLFPDIVYLLDTRESVESPVADCPENDVTDHTDFSVQALLSHHNNLPVVFYYFDEAKAWSMDLSLDKEYGYWDDQLANIVLTHWFPANFPPLLTSDLNTLSTDFEIAFNSDASYEKHNVVDALQASLPPETFVHYAHPQKEGDMSFVRLLGRVVVPDNGDSSQVVYCGYTPPDWYGPPYQTELVKAPQEGIRSDFYEAAEDAWTSNIKLRNGTSGAQWTTLGVSKPGFVHLLWTTDDDVYYADGWADGSGWSEAQRLGDGSWNMDIAANTSGEVHLLWSTFTPKGSMHVWKNEQGEWQEPEYWEGIGYFSQAILDQESVLHLGYKRGDGLDQEFFYQNWTKENGLSEPENVSRRLGDGGDGILRIDSHNAVHAAWAHPLNSAQYIDPLSGQIFDQVGVFYSRRLGPLGWTLPEQVGTLASFAYSMDFILTDEDEPVVAWQSDDGIMISMMHDNGWTEPYLLATAIPPDTPAPFGPDRWGEVTAEIRFGKDDKGNIYAAWVTTANGLYLSKYDGDNWSTPEQISEPGWIFSLNIAVASDGAVHLLYFKNTDSDRYSAPLFHTLISEDGMSTTKFDVFFTGYGLDDNQLLLDEAGYVYALGLPRSPSWFVFIPPNGIRPPATPTPVITLTATPLTPTQTPASVPTVTPTLAVTMTSPQSYPTATPSVRSGAETSNISIFTGFLLLAGLVIGTGWIVFRKKP